MSFQKGWPRPAGNNQMNPIFQVAAGQQFGNVQNLMNLNNLINSAAFGNIMTQQQRPPLLPQVQPVAQRSNSPQNKKRSFVGSITKFLEGYGFIDEEVFFQTNVVTGGQPYVGARVMCEALYNSTMPFHWNATSVQIIPDNNPPAMHNNPPRNTRIQPSGNRWEPSTNGDSSRHDRYGSHHREREISHSRRSPIHSRRDAPSHRPVRRSPPPRRPSPGKSPIRRAEKRERSPRRESPLPRRDIREHSKTREESGPPRRRARVVPRYSCKTVRPLAQKNINCLEMRQRYTRLYVPSDFITCEMSWLDSFSLEAPFQMGLTPITFHPVHKDVDAPTTTPEDMTPPADEDHKYIVRTLLLSHSGIADIRKKVFGLLPDGSIDENAETMPFNKAIQFLTGIRGRNEVMAIGGAYAPSRDGENPLDLPTMIKTAVRTTRELTGVDLSACSTWYKIAHLEYYRAERDRVDNVVLLMPDTSSMNNLMPTPEQYEAIVTTLKAQLAEKISAIEAEEFISTIEKKRKEASAAATAAATVTTDDDTSLNPNVSVTSDTNAPSTEGTVPPPTHTAESTTTTTTTETTTAPVTEAPPPTTAASIHEDSMMETDGTNEKIHWSTTLSALRVADLREQLTLRGLDTKGVKNVLIQRLQKALDDEKLAEENGTSTEVVKSSEEPAPVAPEVMETSVEEEQKEPVVPESELEADGDIEITLDQLEEKQDEEDFTTEELEEIRREKEKFDVIQNERKQALIRHYVFPEQPTVLVYPNKQAKGGRFDCKVTSLQSLLEYRIEDNKEASFEAFVFAEAIREVFDRVHAFNIYKTLQSVNDHETEAQKRKEALIAATVATESKPENGEDTPKSEAVTDPEKEKEREKNERDLLANFKQLVGNFELFTSFAYYDQNVCGYLAERDCEDILLSLGLRISRGDIVRLLKKVIQRDNFNYRNYTDRWVDKDNVVKYSAAFKDDAPTINQLINLHPNASSEDSEAQKTTTVTPDVTENGIVIYKGAALNIKQSLERHQEIKEECTRLVTQLQEGEFVLKSYKEQVDTLDKKRKRLETDVAHYKKKAYDAEKCLKTNEDDVVAYKTALQDCKRLGDRICGIVERVMPAKEKTKEPSAKPEASKKSLETNGVSEDVKPPTESTEATTTDDATTEVSPEDEKTEVAETNDVSMEEVKAEEEATA